MQNHQKYFPTFDKKENITNNFFVIADTKDQKGFVKIVENVKKNTTKRFSPQQMINHFKKTNDLKMFKEFTLPFSSIIKTNKVLLTSGLVSANSFIIREPSG